MKIWRIIKRDWKSFLSLAVLITMFIGAQYAGLKMSNPYNDDHSYVDVEELVSNIDEYNNSVVNVSGIVSAIYEIRLNYENETRSITVNNTTVTYEMPTNFSYTIISRFDDNITDDFVILVRKDKTPSLNFMYEEIIVNGLVVYDSSDNLVWLYWGKDNV